MSQTYCPYCDRPIGPDQDLCTAEPCIEKATELRRRMAKDAEENPYRMPRGHIYLDVNGTLDTLAAEDARSLLDLLDRAGWHVVVWSGLQGGQICGRWIESKDLRRLPPHSVVVDDDPTIRNVACRLAHARCFHPDELTRLPDLLEEQ